MRECINIISQPVDVRTASKDVADGDNDYIFFAIFISIIYYSRDRFECIIILRDRAINEKLVVEMGEKKNSHSAAATGRRLAAAFLPSRRLSAYTRCTCILHIRNTRIIYYYFVLIHTFYLCDDFPIAPLSGHKLRADPFSAKKISKLKKFRV